MRIGRLNIGLDSQINNAEIITTPAKTDKKEKFFDVLGGMLDLSRGTLSDQKTVSTKLLLANREWVFRNNDVIASEVSKIEFELYSVGLKDGEIVYDEINSHPLLDLLDKPNEETTKSDFIYVIQSHKKLTGDAFYLKIRNGSQIVSLRSLPPDKIKLVLRPPTQDDPTIIEAYEYHDVIDGNKVSYSYRPEDIIHLKKPDPNNLFRGISTVAALADTIDIDNLTIETTKSYFKNGAIQNFALTTDTKITEEQLRRLKGEIRQSMAGVRNAFNIPIFGGGLTPTDISYSNKDQEFLAQLEWYRDKIMVGFGNTKASLGIIDDVNRASHQSSINAWLSNTIKPEMAAIVNILNEFLVPEFGDNLVLGFCDPVPEDRSDDVEEVKALYPTGILTLNEARAMLGMDETDGGDEFYSAPTPVINPNGDDDEETPTD